MKKINNKIKRKLRNRKKLKRLSNNRYRICVSKSLNNLSAQIIDDVSKKTLVNLYKYCICLPVPIFEAYGSRIKIIEALMLGTVVLSTTKGIEGLDYKKKSCSPIVTNSIFEFSKKILQISKNKRFKKDSVKDKTLYLNRYGMKNQTKIFFSKLLKII